MSSYIEILKLIAEQENKDELMKWLDWWHIRRCNIFRAYTGYGMPRSNLAEVVHANWVNRGQTGLNLVGSAEIDTSDSLITDAEMTQFSLTNKVNGSGPSLADVMRRREERQIDAANQICSDLVMHGVGDTISTPFMRPTTSDSGCAPPTNKKMQVVCSTAV